MLKLFVTSIALTALGSCISTPPPAQDSSDAAPDAAGAVDARADATASDTCRDPDGDGYLAVGCTTDLPFDCAPTDPARHPGALEVCGDSGTDNDCSHPTGDPLGDIGDCPPKLRPVELFPDSNGTWVHNEFFSAWFGPEVEWLIKELYPRFFGQEDMKNVLTTSGKEKHTGVELWDTFRSVEPTVAPSSQVLAAGSAVYRLHVQWAAGPSSEVTGETIYTITPDGRMHRDESVTVSAAAAGAQTYLTAFIALDPSKFTHADWSWNAGAPYDLSTYTTGLVVPTGSTSPADQGYTCAYDEANSQLVGFSWYPTASSPGAPRVTHTDLGGETPHLALQFDWLQDQVVPAGTYTGNFLMFIGYPDSTTPCEPIAVHSQAFRLPPRLDVAANTELITDYTGDDDADGYSEGGGFFSLRATGDARTIEFSVNTLSATRATLQTSLFRLEGLSHVHDPVVWRNTTLLAQGVDYFYQTEAQTQADGPTGWLYIDEVLTDGDKLTVRIPPAS